MPPCGSAVGRCRDDCCGWRSSPVREKCPRDSASSHLARSGPLSPGTGSADVCARSRAPPSPGFPAGSGSSLLPSLPRRTCPSKNYAPNGCFLHGDFLFCRLFHDVADPRPHPHLPTAGIPGAATALRAGVRVPVRAELFALLHGCRALARCLARQPARFGPHRPLSPLGRVRLRPRPRSLQTFPINGPQSLDRRHSLCRGAFCLAVVCQQTLPANPSPGCKCHGDPRSDPVACRRDSDSSPDTAADHLHGCPGRELASGRR